MLQSFLTYLRRPVDAAALAYFRVAFGLLMVAEMLRYLSKSRVREFWIEPGFHFKYYGFGWVQPLPGDVMIYLAVAPAVAALLVALGLFYHPDAAVHAVVSTRLNARPPALLIDPEADLASVAPSLSHATWILPLPDKPRPPNT